MSEIDLETTRTKVTAIMDEFTRKDKILAIKYDLTPSLAQLLLLLIELPYVTSEIYIASKIMKTDIKTAMMRLRKRLQKHGVTIQSNRAMGYFIDGETRNGIS